MWNIYFTKQAEQDAKKIAYSKLKIKVEELFEIIKIDPFSYPPEFEILKGKLKGFISRKINDQHRLVYHVDEKNKAIKILKMWTHYE
jgi:Txe/YoeB family toxin of toxin-antitoxin system